MVFKKCVRVRGGLGSSFVFESSEDVTNWFNTEFPKLEDKYGKLEYTVSDLDGLKEGDECHVVGEGTDTFIIEGVFKYSNHRWGFALNSGWSEEVAKCYKVPA
jgi:hypothetical protein